MATVRYALPSRTYSGTRKRSRSTTFARNWSVMGCCRRNVTTARSFPVFGLSAGTKCGLGRKRTSSTMSASSGTPNLKPKLRSVTSRRRAARLRERLEPLPQLVHGQVGGVDDLVGERANLLQLPPLRADAFDDGPA